MRAKRSRLKRLIESPTADDLFGFGVQDRQNKINTLESEIQALERGEFNYYVPQTYINSIKEWI